MWAVITERVWGAGGLRSSLQQFETPRKGNEFTSLCVVTDEGKRGVECERLRIVEGRTARG